MSNEKIKPDYETLYFLYVKQNFTQEQIAKELQNDIVEEKNYKLFLGNAYTLIDELIKNGSVATSTKATQDSAGQQITSTYIKGLSVSGKTITYTKGDGTTGTITTQDTTYGIASTSANGLMSSSDKKK